VKRRNEVKGKRTKETNVMERSGSTVCFPLSFFTSFFSPFVLFLFLLSFSFSRLHFVTLKKEKEKRKEEKQRTRI